MSGHPPVILLALALVAAVVGQAQAQASFSFEDLHFSLDPADLSNAEWAVSANKPGCVACNANQLRTCWNNLRSWPAYPADGILAESDVCELQPAMEAFWHCIKACSGEGGCSAADLAKLGVRECAGDPTPCEIGGCPGCPIGFRATDVMTWGCEQKGILFENYGCLMDCGENVCGNCPPPLPTPTTRGFAKHDLAECNLETTWEALTTEFANEMAYAGGLGTLMGGYDNPFEVWLCMKNHPCLAALETEGKKVPLHVRMPASTSMSQGWSSSTAEECVFPFVYGGETYYQCTTEGSSSGPWCATTRNYDLDTQWTTCSTPSDVWSNAFPSCKSSGYSQCVFPFIYQGKSYHSCIDGWYSPWCATTSNYDFDGQWSDCTCNDANVDGAVHQVYADYDGSFAAMGITSGDMDGRLEEACLGAATIEFETFNMLTGASISGVSHEIYTDGAYSEYTVSSDYLGCDLTASCGTAVTASWDSGMTKAAVTAETWYLIVTKASGFYTTYRLIFLTSEGYWMSSSLVEEMAPGQDRVVLHWAHDGDLDLWAYDADNLNNKVGWSRSSASFAGGTMSLDVDNGSGFYGPETTQFQSLSGANVMVWIHHYSGKFTREEVQGYPASVDIFCHTCTDDNGDLKYGYVTTVTQKVNDVPSDPTVSWWKVGTFEAAADGSAQWVTCADGCYKSGPVGPPPPVSLSLSASDAVYGSSLSGVTWLAYTAYPYDFDGCADSADSTACGNERPISDVPADEWMLVVGKKSGYYTVYYEIYSGFSGASATIQMVEAMAVDQSRVVLRWDHNGDLDLWVWEKDNKNNKVGWYTSSNYIAGGSVTLDRDNWNGAYGPETTQFNAIDTSIEVWVNYYGSYSPYTVTRVMTSPASVDVYCYDCLDDDGNQKSGFVTTITQNADDVTGDQYHWWKAGTYMSTGGSPPIRWVTCTSNCYQMNNPMYSSTRRSSHDNMPAKPPNAAALLAAQSTAVPRKCRRPYAHRTGHLRRAKRKILPASSELRSHAAPQSCGSLLFTFHGDESVVYGNPTGIQYLIVSSAPGYGDKVYTLVTANYYGAFLDGAFYPDGFRSRKPLPSASAKNALLSKRGGNSIASNAPAGSALRSDHLSSSDDFKFYCWVFNENDRSFVPWGTNDEVRLVKPRDVTVWLSMSAVDLLETDSALASISGSTYFVYKDYPSNFMGCVGTGMLVDVNFLSPDIYGNSIAGVEYYFYSPYPRNYLGCRGWIYADQNSQGASCGTLAYSFTGGSGQVAADQWYLVVSVMNNYYTSYSLAYVGLGGYSSTFRMIGQLPTDSTRVVLKWAHSGDLDLYVYDAQDYSNREGWDASFTGATGETIELQLDSYDTGIPLETTELAGQQGEREVWVKYYDSAFSKLEVADYPATVDVYCENCYYKGALKIGYVTTVRQSASALSNPVKWWKAGHFVRNDDSSTSWIDCTIDCWAVFPGAGPAVAIEFEAQDMVSGASLSGVFYQIYMNYAEPYMGCEDDSSCGTLIAQSEGAPAAVPSDDAYLVVGSLSGFYTSYSVMQVATEEKSVGLQFVEEMLPGQDRVVLEWSHTQDLDLWVFDALDLNKKVGWYAKSANLAGGTVQLDVDNWSGLYGPETTQFQSLTSGTTMVWVHHYDTTYQNPQVDDYPASVHIFCYQCTDDNGDAKAGYVTTVTQNPSDVPYPGVKWWKVGQFVATGGSVAWETCGGPSCYKSSPVGPAPQVTVQFSASNVIDPSASVTGISYEVYKGYPEDFMGCDLDSTCGTLVASGNGDSVPLTIDGDEFYLVVATHNDWYTSYTEIATGLDDSYETVDMVERMSAGQNRVVLRWGHTSDLDLMVVNSGNRDEASVWWTLGEPVAMGGGTVTLDKDVVTGPGVETTQFNGLDPASPIEVWVDKYGGRHLDSTLRQHPASLDVYCDSCYFGDSQVSGYVTTVTQHPDNLPSGGSRYWKVGQFEGSPLAWVSCTDGEGCYTNTNPQSLRRRSHVEKPTPAALVPTRTIRKTRRPKTLQASYVRAGLARHGKVRRPLSARTAHLRAVAPVINCGTLVAKTTDSDVKVHANTHYLVVSTLTGFYHGYGEAWVNLGGGMSTGRMVTELGQNEARLVLSWGNSQDFDFYVYSSDYTKSVGYSGTEGTSGSIAGATFSLDVDSTSGKAGAETIHLTSSDTLDGTVEFWVQHYDDVFTDLEVSNFPATADVFCYSCMGDDGFDKDGWVQAVYQYYSSSRALKLKWWKVGGFVGASGALRWESCASDCFAAYPGAGAVITVNFALTGMLSGSPISSGVTFLVFRNYVSDWMGCDPASCGTLVVSVSGNSADIPGGETFLVVAEHASYYRKYFLLTTSTSGPMNVESDMVQLMETDQNRVVLSWAHDGDLDLESYYFGERGLSRVYYANPYAEFVGGTVTLDVDNGNGFAGPETHAFQGLGSGGETGTVMVWVKHYSGMYTRSAVASAPAKVDVYCYSCNLQFSASNPKTGYVTTVHQSAGDVPIPGAKFWKVGQFVVTAGLVEWQSCGGPECYNSEVVAPAEPVSVSFSSFDPVSQSSLSGESYEVFAQYPADFEGCVGSECGVSVASGRDVSLPASADYLVVVQAAGYYTKYYEIGVETDAMYPEITMVEQMVAGQKRVLLSWFHNSDLDLQVVNANDRTQKVTYSDKNDAIAMAGGTVTLDADDGGPGAETIQFNNVNNGEVEVWVHHYSNVFTSGQTAAYPASVDVFCDTCNYDGATDVVGYVTTVTQDYTMLGVSSSPEYWLVGTFSGSGAEVTWTTCSGTCYFDSAGYLQSTGSLMGGRRRGSQSTKALHVSAPREQKDKLVPMKKKAAPPMKTRRKIFKSV